VKPTVRRPPLLALMLASFAVGFVLMMVFEAPITRIVGLITLFVFIVSGVFLIADPAFLGQDDDGDGADGAAHGVRPPGR
jgi:hypothetical protein